MPSIIQRSVTYTGNNTTSNPNFTWVNVDGVSWITRSDTATTGTSDFSIQDNNTGATRTSQWEVRHWNWVNDNALVDSFTITQTGDGTVTETTAAPTTAAPTTAAPTTAAPTTAAPTTAAPPPVATAFGYSATLIDGLTASTKTYFCNSYGNTYSSYNFSAYHDGTGTYPAVGDTLYYNSTKTSLFRGSSAHTNGSSFKIYYGPVVKVNNTTGVVEQVEYC